MKRWLKILLISMVVMVTVLTGMLLILGRDAHATLEGDLSGKLDQYLLEEEFRGVVYVSKDGEEVLKKGYGMATIEDPNTPETLYQIASLSKTFTAIAIMQLVEAEKLSLQDQLSAFFPEYPNAETITIEQLLSHSSGIPDYLQPEFEFDYSKEWKPDDIINVTQHAELEFSPGESFHYSNTGYVMLGRIIEKVTGLTYAEYIEQAIFEPSHMTNSTFTLLEGQLAAVGHVEGKQGPEMNNTAAFAAGDILSTVEDLALFDQALRNYQLVSKETDELMATTKVEKFPYKYGLGWYTQDVMGFDAVGHSGGYPSGFRHYITRFMDQETTVIVLSNEMTVNSKTINRNLTSILLERPIWIWEEMF